MDKYSELDLNSTRNFSLTGRALGSVHGSQDYSGTLTLSGSRIVCDEWLISLIKNRDELLSDLQEATATLRRYETSHRAKGTEESTVKAEVNAQLAARFEATIAKAQAGAK